MELFLTQTPVWQTLICLSIRILHSVVLLFDVMGCTELSDNIQYGI